MNLLDRMQSALKRSRADYTELRIEYTTSSWLSFRGPELDSIGINKSVGGIVRALVKGGWGIVTFNDINELEARVEEAYDCARLVGKEKSQLAEVPPVVDNVPAFMEKDFRGIALDDKRRLIEEYNNLILKHHPKIQTTSVGYSDSFREVFYANSEGSAIRQEIPDCSLFLSATARDGDNTQRGFEGVATIQGFGPIEGQHERALKAAQRAVELLSAPKVKGGRYTVVLNQRLAGVFAHEAFGHLSEADNVHENPKLREIMVLGKRFGSDILSIGDDGSVEGLRATRKYDDEGVRTRRNYLIKDGILVGRLHSRETAGKLGEQPTGNARAISWSYEPIVRMTNTFIEPGKMSFEEIIADIDEGIYALDMFGGQTAVELFTFSAAYAYMIRKGQIAEMVRDVTLSGNVFETLLNVEAVGSDFQWSQSGGCGKGGQNGLPTTFGSGSLRIRNVVVGGA